MPSPRAKVPGRCPLPQQMKQAEAEDVYKRQQFYFLPFMVTWLQRVKVLFTFLPFYL